MVNGTPTWQRLGLTVNLNLQPLISSLCNDLLEQSDDDREFKKESSSERVLATPSFLKSLKRLFIYIHITLPRSSRSPCLRSGKWHIKRSFLKLLINWRLMHPFPAAKKNNRVAILVHFL